MKPPQPAAPAPAAQPPAEPAPRRVAATAVIPSPAFLEAQAAAAALRPAPAAPHPAPAAAPAPVAAPAAAAAPAAPSPLPDTLFGASTAAPARPGPAFQPPPERPGGIPGWLAFVLSVVGFSGLVAGGFYVMRGKPIWATEDAAAPPKTVVEDTAPIQQMEGSHPLAKFIEVTGVRLIGSGGKAQLKFLVVNHSAGALDGVQLEVNIRERSNQASAESAPLFTVATPIKRIGPFESRDYTIPVQTNQAAMELPDWQFLRATFKVVNQ